MQIDQRDVDALIREKYDGNREAPGLATDSMRLEKGEPLAYVIGHIPFLGLSLDLFSHPLIPRPETEWWTNELITYIGERPLSVLDLCAGSGAIGLAILKHCKNVRVSFGELMEEHEAVIRKNIVRNELDASRADVRIGDLFRPFLDETFDLIATNPPYIPKNRVLEKSVADFEPSEALFAGEDGLDVIRRIYGDVSAYIAPKGEVWMECDTENIEAASALAIEGGASYTKIRIDHYNRPRLLVAYY